MLLPLPLPRHRRRGSHSTAHAHCRKFWMERTRGGLKVDSRPLDAVCRRGVSCRCAVLCCAVIAHRRRRAARRRWHRACARRLAVYCRRWHRPRTARRVRHRSTRQHHLGTSSCRALQPLTVDVTVTAAVIAAPLLTLLAATQTVQRRAARQRRPCRRWCTGLPTPHTALRLRLRRQR